MKNHLQTFAALCGALVLAACASTDSSTTDGAVRPYPLDTCIVTDNALGSMGDPITKVYDGQEIKFCCKPCVAEFEANPAEFLKNLPK
jgi:hypothetical protein